MWSCRAPRTMTPVPLPTLDYVAQHDPAADPASQAPAQDHVPLSNGEVKRWMLRRLTAALWASSLGETCCLERGPSCRSGHLEPPHCLLLGQL